MSYASAAALQAAIYARLTAATALAGVSVLDGVPAGGGTGTFLLLGPETALDRSDKSGGGAEHRLVISVISDAAGFQASKEIGVAVCDALIDAPLVLTRGHLVAIQFLRAVAKRLGQGGTRRIDLTFRARVET